MAETLSRTTRPLQFSWPFDPIGMATVFHVKPQTTLNNGALPKATTRRRPRFSAT